MKHLVYYLQRAKHIMSHAKNGIVFIRLTLCSSVLFSVKKVCIVNPVFIRYFNGVKDLFQKFSSTFTSQPIRIAYYCIVLRCAEIQQQVNFQSFVRDIFTFVLPTIRYIAQIPFFLWSLPFNRPRTWKTHHSSNLQQCMSFKLSLHKIMKHFCCPLFF